ncbi:MAG: hypothetical protein ACOC10_10570 [Bacteroidota bacterium]
MNSDERLQIEQMAAAIKNGKTNYFQMEKEALTGPRMLQKKEKDGRNVITWQTAYAGDDPLDHYEVMVDGKLAGNVQHKPQTLKSKPFMLETELMGKEITVAAVDVKGNRTEAKLA